ncbi:MAG TPA: nucleotidyltransferase family protein [Methylomirabilota bacterium]|nr:nucleotidyltransferase family protein [Methylomirabilota bacterium]
MTAALDRLMTAIPEEPERFDALCRDVTDWITLVESAGRDGVLGILRREIVLARIPVPEDARRLLERLEAVERLWQANVTRALDRVLLALDVAGIQTAALKGPVLAERLYPEASMRRCTDLDLLIAERDIERAARALEPLGYELEDGLAALYARRHHHHLHLAGRCPPVIELHFRAYVGFGVTLPAEALLARARAHRTGGGAPCWVLAPEDELLYLGVHAAGHCFDRLLWLYDLKLFMSRNPSLDWALLAERARAFGVEAAWALARDVLKRRLGVAAPAATNGRAPARLGRRLVARFVDGRVGPPAAGPLVTLRQLLVMAALCDRPASAARFVGHHVARIVRRRAQRWLPALVPAEWAA